MSLLSSFIFSCLLLASPLSSSRFFSFYWSGLLFSCLVNSFVFLSCLVSLSMSPCGVVCCGVCVVWCVARLGTQKKPPCVDSKRPRVCRHHAHMCYHMRAWCRYTRGRFESTHGGFLDGHTGERGGKGRRRGVTVSSANHETAHVELSRASERFTERNPWISHIQGLRTGRELSPPIIRFTWWSCWAPAILRDTAEGISTHNTHHSPPAHTLVVPNVTTLHWAAGLPYSLQLWETGPWCGRTTLQGRQDAALPK